MFVQRMYCDKPVKHGINICINIFTSVAKEHTLVFTIKYLAHNLFFFELPPQDYY